MNRFKLLLVTLLFGTAHLTAWANVQLKNEFVEVEVDKNGNLTKLPKAAPTKCCQCPEQE